MTIQLEVLQQYFSIVLFICQSFVIFLRWWQTENSAVEKFLFRFFPQNLADIVAKQQKLKYYSQLKSGRYTPLCKTPETLENELQKQRARLQSLMTIVDRLNQEFPQAQPALRKITLSLGYRGMPEEAAA